MLILRGRQLARPSYKQGQFFLPDIIVVLPIAEARAKPTVTLFTVTGVLTVSDQFAGSIQDETGAIAVLTKQFMVPDYSK
jgi:hypothetical protein